VTVRAIYLKSRRGPTFFFAGRWHCACFAEGIGNIREEILVTKDKESVVIPVASEEAEVSRERVETGVVNVRKIVQERVEAIDEPMLHDERKW
jgi:hypothetical protein